MRHPEDPTLAPSTPRIDALRTAMESGLATRSARWSAGRGDWSIRVARASACSLAEFPERAVFCDADMLASVLLSFQGGVGGTVIVAFEPKTALALLRATSSADALPVGEQALARYRELGSTLAAGLIAGLLGSELGTGRPALVEDALIPTLLATHPLPDTVILSAEIEVGRGAEGWTGFAYLLLDPKGAHALLSRL